MLGKQRAPVGPCCHVLTPWGHAVAQHARWPTGCVLCACAVMSCCPNMCHGSGQPGTVARAARLLLLLPLLLMMVANVVLVFISQICSGALAALLFL